MVDSNRDMEVVTGWSWTVCDYWSRSSPVFPIRKHKCRTRSNGFAVGRVGSEAVVTATSIQTHACLPTIEAAAALTVAERNPSSRNNMTDKSNNNIIIVYSTKIKRQIISIIIIKTTTQSNITNTARIILN
jgi:hypothetical protein